MKQYDSQLVLYGSAFFEGSSSAAKVSANGSGYAHFAVLSYLPKFSGTDIKGFFKGLLCSAPVFKYRSKCVTNSTPEPPGWPTGRALCLESLRSWIK